MKNLKLSIGGMQCASCAQIIEMSLKELKGIKSVLVNSKNNTANVEFDETQISPDNIKKSITKLGYKTN